jgi:hypothetical protein
LLDHRLELAATSPLRDVDDRRSISPSSTIVSTTASAAPS